MALGPSWAQRLELVRQARQTPTAQRPTEQRACRCVHIPREQRRQELHRLRGPAGSQLGLDQGRTQRLVGDERLLQARGSVLAVLEREHEVGPRPGVAEGLRGFAPQHRASFVHATGGHQRLQQEGAVVRGPQPRRQASRRGRATGVEGESRQLSSLGVARRAQGLGQSERVVHRTPQQRQP